MPKSADSDSVPNQDEPSWTLLDRDGLVDAYWDVIAPAMRTDGLDPETEQPTYDWLNSYGFRQFIYTLGRVAKSFRISSPPCPDENRLCR